MAEETTRFLFCTCGKKPVRRYSTVVLSIFANAVNFEWGISAVSFSILAIEDLVLYPIAVASCCWLILSSRRLLRIFSPMPICDTCPRFFVYRSRMRLKNQ